MKTQNLLASLRAFKALFDSLWKEPLNEECVSAVDQLYEGYIEVLCQMLKTQYFAFGTDPDGDYAGIFDNEAERDSFIEKIHKLNEELKELGDTGEMICKPISFEEFQDFADGEQYDLDNYSLAEDGAIEFVPNFAEP